jgi:DNA-binding response OmpR family regulator
MECAVLHARRVSRILLVEDQPLVRQAVTRGLVRNGHVVVSATTVAGALALIAVEAFEIVLTDLHLPDGQGDAVVAAVRERCEGTPVIVLSGSYDGDHEQGHEDGSVAHFAKPFDLGELLATISLALDGGPRE